MYAGIVDAGEGAGVGLGQKLYDGAWFWHHGVKYVSGLGTAGYLRGIPSAWNQPY